MTSDKRDEVEDNQPDSSSDTEQEDSDSLSAKEKAKNETERNRPDTGYYLIQRDTFKEPWRQETAMTSTHSLKLSEMSVPDDSGIIKHRVRDEELNSYSDELRTGVEKTPDELIRDLKTAWSEEDEKGIRLTLAHIAQVVKNNPSSSCVDAVETLTDAVAEGSQPVQAEALGILQSIASVNSNGLSEVVNPTIEILEQDVHPKLSAQAFKLIGVLIPSYPEEASHSVATLTTLLNDSNLADEPVAKAIEAVAKEKPTALTSVVGELGTYLESDDVSIEAQKHVLAALGRTAKRESDPVADIVPQLIGLLDSHSPEVQVNATGVLADVAEARPTAVEPAVPSTIDLLTIDDAKGRHNATSVMARVAKTEPDAVEPALNELIELLEADDVETRLNACSAISRMNAESALGILKERSANDPNKELRQLAEQAIEKISESTQ